MKKSKCRKVRIYLTQNTKIY